jgi:hypothetical protein
VKPDEANLQRLEVEEFVWDIPAATDNGAESSSDESDEEKVILFSVGLLYNGFLLLFLLHICFWSLSSCQMSSLS